jgi:iron(III) transport system ATP-binding protein
MIAVTLEGLSKIFARAGTVVDTLDLQIRRGEFFTLLGPSGCGKSTLLRIIAGFETPTTGRVLFDDCDVTDVPPHRRGLGFAFQNYALFPHLTVAENVAFGLRVRRIDGRETARRVREALSEVRLDGCEAERVDRLSGGQQQRVALARALVLRPGLLLLDEPLSNLDARLRQDARTLITSIHRSLGCTIVYVTHDQSEAMTMSDRVAVLSGGRLQQVATAQEVYERPATVFVADFIGRNNVLGAVLWRTDEHRSVIRFKDGTEIALPSWCHGEGVSQPGEPVEVCVRPESLRLSDGDGIFVGTIAGIEYGGATRLCRVDSNVGELQIEISRSATCPEIGRRVSIAIDESALHLIPRESRS